MRVSRGAQAPDPSLLRVGSAHIDVALREVRGREGAGPVRRVTPKALGVLLELAARPGEVVTREALLAAVWPDTLPTDDVLTQAVTQLRKVFRTACGPDECIQTIAKSGYRLLAPVEVLARPAATTPTAAAVAGIAAVAQPAHAHATDRADPLPTPADAPRMVPSPTAPAAAPPPAPPRPAPRPAIGRRTLGLSLVAGAALVGLLGWWLGRGAPVAPVVEAPVPSGPASLAPPRERPALRLVTSAPGAETAPAFSPDGRRLAFVAIPPGAAGTAVHVQALSAATATVLTRPPAGLADDSPVFSPDGQRIAYRRSAPDGRCEVRIAEANGLGERRVASCPPGSAAGLDWSPDASRLVAAHAQVPTRPTRLHVLELASGRWTPVSTAAQDADAEAHPRFTADGRALVFVRNPPAGDLWRVPVAGSTAQRLTRLHADIRGWQWADAGTRVVLSHFLEGEFRLARVSLADGRAADLGLASAQQPAVARGSGMLAFVRSSAAYDLLRARLPAGGPSAHVLEPVLPSTGRELMPALAPDGDRLLFASDRSGSLGLWLARLSDPASLRQVAGVTPRARHAAVWSMDGRRALLPTLDGAGTGLLMELDAGTGTARAVPVPVAEPLQAAYGAPDELLVVAGGGDRPPRLLRFDRRGTPWRQLAQWPDATRVRVAAGRAWFTRPGRAGLWSLALDLDPASLRLENAAQPSVADSRLWEVDAAGRPWLLGQVPGCASRLRPIGRAVPAGAGRCLDARHRAAFNGFALSADGRSALFAAVTDEEADIAVQPLPQG